MIEALPRRTQCIINVSYQRGIGKQERRNVRNVLILMTLYQDTRRRLGAPRSHDGYSLTEMLVVLAIIAVMTAVIIPQIAFQEKGSGLKGAATELMSTLRATRRIAIAERQYHALAINLHAIPAEFSIMRPKTSSDSGPQLWIPVGESHRLPDNIAVVSISTSGWTKLDVTRTDDFDFSGAEDPRQTNTAVFSQEPAIFNPELNAGVPGPNSIVNPIFRMIRFYPTGTADRAVIYLWNTTEARREIPNPNANLSAANLSALGVPPGLSLDVSNNQQTFFNVPSEDSPDDAYYYTLVVNRLTGAVEVYDYAWGNGGSQWDRKKDGE